MSKGKVYLVGAGPGDADLLTVKGEKLIRSADAIVFDERVRNVIIDMAKPSAKLFDASKASKDETGQELIKQTLLDMANEYSTVVRLKFGDPFLFSRGGEELQYLKEHNVSFEVIPGVTAISAIPAYAGIPVAHRELTSSIQIITGDGKNGLETDYASLVKQKSTLIYILAISFIKEITTNLIAHGMDNKTPCAVIEDGTLSTQRKFISTIENITKEIENQNINRTAIIIIGDVVSLSSELDWFSHKPLKNIKILSTQRTKNPSKLIPRMKEQGAEVTFCPTIQTTTTIPQSFDIDKYSVIIFSSMQGVDSFFECLAAQGKDARALFGKKIGCVGSQTGKIALSRGIKADYIPDVFSAKNMVEGMIENGMLAKDDTLLVVRPHDGTDEILDVLNSNNIKYDDIEFYKTEFQSQKHIDDISEFDYITFSSKSTVDSFVKSQKHLDFSNSIAICIGNQTAKSAAQYGFKVVEADETSLGSMMDKIIALSK